MSLINEFIHTAQISIKHLIIDKLILNCYLFDKSLYLNLTDNTIVSILL